MTPEEIKEFERLKARDEWKRQYNARYYRARRDAYLRLMQMQAQGATPTGDPT